MKQGTGTQRLGEPRDEKQLPVRSPTQHTKPHLYYGGLPCERTHHGKGLQMSHLTFFHIFFSPLHLFPPLDTRNSVVTCVYLTLPSVRH